MSPIPRRPSSLLRHGIVAEQDAPARATIKRALLIGASGRLVDSVQTLKGPHRDATDMARLLEEKYNYNPDEITLLLDDGVHGDPTAANILASLDALVRGVQAGDRLFFYYAGHADQNANPEKDDEMNLHLVASDGQWIQDDTLYHHLIQPLPSGCILRAVIDACHSGSLLDLTHSVCNRVDAPWVSEGQKPRTRKAKYRPVRKNAMPGPSPLPGPSPPKRLRRSPSASSRSRSSMSSCSFHSGGSGSSQWQVCDGVACFGGELYKPRIPACTDILCVSSSRDEQRTWENQNGDSMTTILVKLLRENPNPSLNLLMTHISHQIHENCMQMQVTAKEYKKEVAAYLEKQAQKMLNLDSESGAEQTGKKRKRAPVPTQNLSIESVYAQDPELSSAVPVGVQDMETRLWDM